MLIGPSTYAHRVSHTEGAAAGRAAQAGRRLGRAGFFKAHTRIPASSVNLFLGGFKGAVTLAKSFQTWGKGGGQSGWRSSCCSTLSIAAVFEKFFHV